MLTSLMTACGHSTEESGNAVAVVDPDAAPPDAGAPDVQDGGEDASDGGDAILIDPSACSDLFTQDALQTYSVEISSAEWASLDAEFHSMTPAEGGGFVRTYHPIVLHHGSETVNAAIRLKGESSWVQAIQYDSDPKAQFVVAFDTVDTSAKFHGISKLDFDMPRSDPTYLRERLGWAHLRDLGVPALCANSARLNINGRYYGLYTTQESWNQRALRRVFPGAGEGDLWDSGVTPGTNKPDPNYARAQALRAADDYASLAKLADMDQVLADWAAEVVINDGDGYYGGRLNFEVYDHPSRGFLWLSSDLDSCYNFESPSQHPLYWWSSTSTGRTEGPGQYYLVVINDAAGRAKLIDAIESATARTNLAAIQARIDAWSAQIAAAASEDPHRPPTAVPFADAIKELRASLAQRRDLLQSFVQCERTGGGTDADGDGVPWCNDCDDHNAGVHQSCGN